MAGIVAIEPEQPMSMDWECGENPGDADESLGDAAGRAT
jgi:hypothetical protein